MIGPTLSQYLVFSALLFCFGLYGMLTRRNLIAMLMSVELILNAAALNFVAFHHFLYEGNVGGAVFPVDLGGAVFPVFIIAVAAAESAIALAIIIALFRHKNQLDVQDADSLKN
jgi:NADH:ubiquinone oxidoreductase subunit K